MKTPFSSVGTDTLRRILADVQYALDGLWDHPLDIVESTGIEPKDAGMVYASISALLNIDLEK